VTGGTFSVNSHNSNFGFKYEQILLNLKKNEHSTIPGSAPLLVAVMVKTMN
jgi:hypothetical protein